MNRRISIHTPAHRLMNPAVRAELYGLTLLLQMLNHASFYANRQLTQHAYPGQPSTRARTVVPPCCCAYVALCCSEWLDGVLWLTGPGQWCEHRGSKYGGWGHIATGFIICPACPHHSTPHTIEELWADPYLNGLLRDPYDMDDDERRGH